MNKTCRCIQITNININNVNKLNNSISKSLASISNVNKSICNNNIINGINSSSISMPYFKENRGRGFSTTTSSKNMNNKYNNKNNNLLQLRMLSTNSKNNTSNRFIDKITIIDTIDKAKKVLQIMMLDPNIIWACDTEVDDIDVKTQGPVGNGKVICISIYGGPDFDFKMGEGKGSALWVDNLGDAKGVLNEFKLFFENEKYKKIWHNYSFDRHVMYNMNIDCKGFFADTMHMARLSDTSRDRTFGGGEGYSLASLSEMLNDSRFVKESMKDLFGVSKLTKAGTESKLKVLPTMIQLQTNLESRDKWIQYSARDAIATWCVWNNIKNTLMNMEWRGPNSKVNGNMYDFYLKYLLDFGECLTDMERNGIKVDTKKHLKDAEKRAIEDRNRMEDIFRKWSLKFCSDAEYINSGSTTQIQQLLFGHFENSERISNERIFKIAKDDEEFQSQKEEMLQSNPYADYSTPELKVLLKERGLKLSGTKTVLINRLLEESKFENMDEDTLKDICLSRGLVVNCSKAELIKKLTEDVSEDENILLPSKVKKYREITIKTIGLNPKDFTPTGVPKVSAAILKKLAGSNLFGDEKDVIWGTALDYFGGNTTEGREACIAIGALANIGQIDSTIANFLVPLQALVDDKSRVHCSLNLNTETGRLSSRKPNLQNQPALEKDQYKIRDAFVAEPGNTLIVADYGQLELRLLAHITSCKSMIEAFKSGGCFHSRTAVGMYPYIKKAVDDGDVLLEWDYSKGQPTVPLVKDTFGSERRKAKTLNFSIAYGKTVFGLANDWGISKEEAQETLSAWYSDRPEVQQWQDMTRRLAKKNKYVRTLMGRYRHLPEAASKGAPGAHSLRAAINTPIQGSAADVVMMAMIKLWKSQILKDLGWKLLLQIHDEVILEGPIESRDLAMKEVRECMENPYDGHGLTQLSDVDAKSADSWYKAK